MTLAEFRQSVQAYRRAVGISQKMLAHDMGLHPNVLSHKLNGSDGALLTHPEIKQIIKLLAGWQAISTRQEACTLLEMMGLKRSSYAEDDWQTAPLSLLDGPAEEGVQSVRTVVASPPPPPPSIVGLPVPATPLIGRERTVRQICERLLHPATRLLTLTGLTGVGKSRLAIEVGQRSAPSFAQGGVFLPLLDVHDAAAVPQAIAQVLGHDALSVPAVLAALASLEMLLIFDGAEHLVAMGPFLADLMTSAPRMRFLVTSCTPLHIYGEHRFWVPPLPCDVPLLEAGEAASRMAPALELFMQRARAVQLADGASSSSWAEMDVLCRQLDGVPLAIELAAARLRFMSLPEMRQGIQGRLLKTLTDGPRMVPGRQQSIMHALQRLYDLLHSDAQHLLRRLSVFEGVWTVEAAQQVCGEGIDLVWALASLIDYSFVWEDADQVSGIAHYRLPGIVREFAQSLVGGREARTALRLRHACYYIYRAENTPSDTTEPMPRVDLGSQQADLTTALGFLREAARSGDAVYAALLFRLCGALGAYWDGNLLLEDGAAWCTAALEQRAVIDRQPHQAYHVLPVLYRAGLFARRAGYYARAAAYLRDCLQLAHDHGDRECAAACLHGLGQVAADAEGDWQTALAYQRESRALRVQLLQPRPLMEVTNDLADICMQAGEQEQGRALLRENLLLCQKLGDRAMAARVYALLGLAKQPADGDDILVLHRALLRLAQEEHDDWRVLGALYTVVHALTKLARPHEALPLLSGVERWRQEAGAVLPYAARGRAVHDLEVLHGLIPDDHFAALWAAGQERSRTALVADALGTAHT